MELLPADYALCAIAVVMAVTGLFRGFSGSLAFVAAFAAAVFAAAFGWTCSASFTAVAWQRVAGVALATLLTFGIVRIVVKKIVNGILSQPSDAIFGMLTGLVMALMLVLAWAWSGIFVEYSRLVQGVAAYVR